MWAKYGSSGIHADAKDPISRSTRSTQNSAWSRLRSETLVIVHSLIQQVLQLTLEAGMGDEVFDFKQFMAMSEPR